MPHDSRLKTDLNVLRRALGGRGHSLFLIVLASSARTRVVVTAMTINLDLDLDSGGIDRDTPLSGQGYWLAIQLGQSSA
jgi:hypothetical protein